MKFEYTAPGMPQQNVRVEHMFSKGYNRVHAILNGENFSSFLRNGLQAETANTATLFENILATKPEV